MHIGLPSGACFHSMNGDANTRPERVRRQPAALLVACSPHESVDAAISVHVTAPDTVRQHEIVDPEPAPPRPAEVNSSSWQWWVPRGIVVLLASLVVAGAVYLISNRVAARYQSSATVRVSVQATSGISDPAVTAANDLASQFAQLASSAPVLKAAATRLGVAASTLEGTVTAGTIAAQNLVRISVTGSSPTQAQERATAVAKGFVKYIDRIDSRQVGTYERAVTTKLAPLAREIAAARKRLLLSTNVEAQRNATVLLSGLLSQQQTVLSSVAQAAAAAQPSLQLVAPGAGGSKISPKPSLYAGVGFLATLILLGRFLYVIGMRRSRLREAPS
jgi:hypothetical protein